jgi:hypothetical protein
MESAIRVNERYSLACLQVMDSVFCSFNMHRTDLSPLPESNEHTYYAQIRPLFLGHDRCNSRITICFLA